MPLIQAIKDLTPDPIKLAKRRLFRRSDGERFLRQQFRQLHGYDLDTVNATTFTEKLYRRMIELNRDGNETFTRLTDKFLARDYVAEAIGSEHLVPLLWNGTSPSRIPFDELPSKCWAKTNHRSGDGILIHSGTNRGETIAMFWHLLQQNFYWDGREYQYYNIRPRVMIEGLLDDGKPSGPFNYRFWCFNGEPKAVQVDNHAHTMNAFYTPSWELTGASYRSASGIREAERPDNLADLLDAAAKLSRSFDFVRVDLYSVAGRVYFGEMTFTPTAGSNKFDPPEWDLKFGQMWPLGHYFKSPLSAVEQANGRERRIFRCVDIRITDRPWVVIPTQSESRREIDTIQSK